MTSDPPTPPAALPDELVDTLEDLSPERLRALSEYTATLAEYRDREPPGEDDDDANPPEDLPDDVPAKATTTIKEINDNRYYYWQWREGDEVKSKYKAPVDPEG